MSDIKDRRLRFANLKQIKIEAPLVFNNKVIVPVFYKLPKISSKVRQESQILIKNSYSNKTKEKTNQRQISSSLDYKNKTIEKTSPSYETIPNTGLFNIEYMKHNIIKANSYFIPLKSRSPHRYSNSMMSTSDTKTIIPRKLDQIKTPWSFQITNYLSPSSD